MQQDHEAVLAGHAVHQVHNHLVLVIGEVGFPEDRRQLELVRGNLVVAGLDRNAEFVSGNLEIPHKCGHTAWDGAEVVVVQLLVLGGVVSHQCPAGNHQVRTGGIEFLIHEEVFLLPAQI